MMGRIGPPPPGGDRVKTKILLYFWVKISENLGTTPVALMENDTKLSFFVFYRNDLCLFLWSCTFRSRRSIFVPWRNLVEWIVNHVLAWIIEPVFPISIDFPGMSKTMWTFFSRLRTSYLLIKAGFYDSLQCK